MMSDPAGEDHRRAVQQLVADVLNRKKIPKKPEEIVEGLSLTRDLGIDSLDVLQIMATVEKRYKLKFSEAEIKGMDELGGILAIIKKHQAAGN
jgi:acyl carrier protein